MCDVLGESWNISQKGLEIITDNNQIKDKSKILENALNSDLKDISSGIINKKSNNITNAVLQIQKIRNISAPKANENSQAAPRMLKITLTDGENYLQAIENEPITQVNRDKTAPGTKLLIKNAPIESGYLLLNDKSFSVLGGRVEHLLEKWEASKMVQLSKNRRQSSSEGGPPLWVNFGCKVNRSSEEGGFKSLDTNRSKENKDNSEFEQQRQEAIAEASSGAIKKVFGGGAKQQTIVPSVPKYNNNIKVNNNPRNKKNARNNRNLTTDNDVDEKPQKPSEKVSLFAFLEDKLPLDSTASKPNKTGSQPQYNNARSFQKPAYQRENKPQAAVDFKPQQNHFKNYQNTPYPKYSAPNNNNKVTSPDEINNIRNKLEKVSLDNNSNNSQFATRTLRQHLSLPHNNLNTAQTEQNSPERHWKIGQECLAKYWEDGKFYNANVTAVTDKTCVVKFKGYGNIEEVLKVDCLPVNEQPQQQERSYGKNKYYTNKGYQQRYQRK